MSKQQSKSCFNCTNCEEIGDGFRGRCSVKPPAWAWGFAGSGYVFDPRDAEAFAEKCQHYKKDDKNDQSNHN
jgi:hypothetical protein